MATIYGITHVRYNTAGTHIDQGRVYSVVDTTVSSNYTTLTREQVVIAIDSLGQTFYTLVTVNDTWQWGAKVETVTVNGQPYLRTDGNSIARDNLGNLPAL